MPYATDADLLLRAPATAAVDPAIRAIALADARARISESDYGDQCVYAHCMLAAHILALEPAHGLGGEQGPVTATAAGSISASYGVGSTAVDGPHASTWYGRAFDAVTRTIPHGPIAVV